MLLHQIQAKDRDLER